MTRDPRVNPQPGDVLIGVHRNNGGTEERTVINCSSSTVTFEEYRYSGKRSNSLAYWIHYWAKNAKVKTICDEARTLQSTATERAEGSAKDKEK